MQTQMNFKDWKNIHKSFIQENIEQKENSRWGRINAKWNEINSNQELNHIYKFTLDLKTGDFYLDCRRRKIWCKSLTYLFVQPIVLSLKTVYHLMLPLSISLEIFQEVQKIKEFENDQKIKLTNKEKTIRIVKVITKDLLDIVRTPLYAGALSIIALAGVVIGPLAPNILYNTRAMAAKVELALHWGNEDSNWIIYRCFHPLGNVITIDQEWQRTREDTKYIKPESSEADRLKGLSNLARALINFRRENRAIFNDCFKLLPANQAYISK